MTYNWFQFGNGEAIFHLVCPLGPHLLEMKEVHFDSNDNIIVRLSAYEWNEHTRSYDRVADLKKHTYDWKTTRTILEDWYACNVLFEDNLGTEDESNKSKNI